MLPVTRLNAIVQTAMITMSCVEPTAMVTRNARPVEMNPPI